MISRSTRPKFLNLLLIKLPITGVVSIAHRISGVILILSLPLMVYALQLSLASAESFALLFVTTETIWGKLLTLLVVWSLLHHLVAGLRFLLLDLDVGIELASARRNAWLVLVLSLTGTAFFAGAWL